MQYTQFAVEFPHTANLLQLGLAITNLLSGLDPSPLAFFGPSDNVPQTKFNLENLEKLIPKLDPAQLLLDLQNPESENQAAQYFVEIYNLLTHGE